MYGYSLNFILQLIALSFAPFLDLLFETLETLGTQ